MQPMPIALRIKQPLYKSYQVFEWDARSCKVGSVILDEQRECASYIGGISREENRGFTSGMERLCNICPALRLQSLRGGAGGREHASKRQTVRLRLCTLLVYLVQLRTYCLLYSILLRGSPNAERTFKDFFRFLRRGTYNYTGVTATRPTNREVQASSARG